MASKKYVMITNETNLREFLGEIPEAPKLNEAYIHDDIIYAFRGKYDEDTNAGIYIEDGDFVIVEYTEGEEVTMDDVVDKELSNVDSLFNNIGKMADQKKKSGKKTTKSSSSKTKPKRRKTNKRISKDEVILMELYPEDDDMVRLLKETINDEGITMQDIYDKFSDDSNGYNLYYGLTTRSTISYKSIVKWCEVLNKEFNMSIKDIDD